MPGSPTSARTRTPSARSGPATCALAVALLLGCAPPVGAAWNKGAVGSWILVEAWNHALGEQHVTRVTTTLLKRTNGALWFQHVNEAGVRWEDADPGAESDWTAPAAGGRDVFVTTQSLRMDGAQVPCRVILNERRSAPWSTSHPVSEWIARTKRWEAIDTTLRVRVLKVLDLGTETHFRDGRIERGRGLSSQVVKSLHEPIRLHGRSYDCWVQITKTLAEDSTFTGRTTVWRYENVPTGWVRRIRETRDPRNGAMNRFQEQLVDFRLQ